MSIVQPFAALRPSPGRAAEVIAPPYDVLSTAEARSRAAGKPWSFLHVSRPEIDLPADIDPHDDRVYEKARENLAGMLEAGVLVREATPSFYEYRITMGSHVQTGLVAAASVQAYDQNRIRRHEHTRPDKEDDRVRQIGAVGAHTGPVLLAYPDAPEVDRILGDAARGRPATDALADDSIRHTLWILDDAEIVQTLTQRFDAMKALYIADGHHRSAAASRVAAARRAAGAFPDSPSQRFLVVAFPSREMQILPYNRLVTDLGTLDPGAFLAALRGVGTLVESSEAVTPTESGDFGIYLADRWFRLRLDRSRFPANDPVRQLDVSLLADNVLAPVLGISDPRRDRRIDFVGGIRGLGELERRVDNGEMAVAFSMFPTRLSDLMAVADAGEVMPPKSTWFEPKLADGMASLPLD